MWLPDELVVHVLSFGGPSFWARAALVCRHWSCVVNNNHSYLFAAKRNQIVGDGFNVFVASPSPLVYNNDATTTASRSVWPHEVVNALVGRIVFAGSSHQRTCLSCQTVEKKERLNLIYAEAQRSSTLLPDLFLFRGWLDALIVVEVSSLNNNKNVASPISSSLISLFELGRKNMDFNHLETSNVRTNDHERTKRRNKSKKKSRHHEEEEEKEQEEREQRAERKQKTPILLLTDNFSSSASSSSSATTITTASLKEVLSMSNKEEKVLELLIQLLLKENGEEVNRRRREWTLRLPEALCLSFMDTNPPYTSIENLSGGLLRVAVLKGTFERGGYIQVLPGRIIRNNTNHEEDDIDTENECHHDYCYQPYSTRLVNIFEANELDRKCSGEQYSSTGKEVAVKGGLALFSTTLDPSLYKNSSFYSFQRVASLHGTTVKVWVEIEVAFCYLKNMLPPGPSNTPVLRISNQRMKQGERILCRTGETAMNISILNICNSKNGQAMTLRGKPHMPLCAAVDDPIMFFLPFVRRLSNGGLSRRWEPAAIGKVLASGVVCTLLPTT